MILLGVFVFTLSGPVKAPAKVRAFSSDGLPIPDMDSPRRLFPPEQKGDPEMRWARRQKGGPSHDRNGVRPDLDRKRHEWDAMPSEKKKVLRQRMKRFKELPPEERSLYQERFRQWQRLSPQERQRIRENLERWQELSPEEREKTRRRFR
jgi:hypothetical protein